MKRPLKNLAAVTAADTASRALGFLATIYLARVLGTSAFGLMSIGLSVLGYVTLLSGPGLHIMGARDVAARTVDDKAYLGRLLSLRAVLAIALILVTAAVSLTVLSPASALVISVFSCAALPMSLSLDWYFQGRENLAVVALSKIAMYVVYLVLLYLFVSHEEDLPRVPMAYLIGTVAASLVLLGFFFESGQSIIFRWETGKVTGMLRQSLPFGASVLLTHSILNLPVLLLGIVLSTSDAGIFNAAMKLVFFGLMLDRILYALFFPLSSRYFVKGRQEFTEIIGLGLKIVIVIAVPIAIAGSFFAAPLIDFVYGPAYSCATDSLRILSVYFLFTVTSSVMMCAVFAAGREGAFVRAVAAGTAAIAILCTVLPPLIGIRGSAIGLAVGEGIIVLLLFPRLRELVDLRLMRIFSPGIAGGVIMYLAIVFLLEYSVVAALLAGTACFLAAVFALGGFAKRDIRLLLERLI